MPPLSCDLPHGDQSRNASETQDSSPAHGLAPVYSNAEPRGILLEPSLTQIRDEPTAGVAPGTLVPELSFTGLSDDLLNGILSYFNEEGNDFITSTVESTSGLEELGSGPSMSDCPVDVKVGQGIVESSRVPEKCSSPVSGVHSLQDMRPMVPIQANQTGLQGIHAVDEHVAIAAPSALRPPLSSGASPLYPTWSNRSLSSSLPPLSRSGTTAPPTALTTPMDAFNIFTLDGDTAQAVTRGTSGTTGVEAESSTPSSLLFDPSSILFDYKGERSSLDQREGTVSLSSSSSDNVGNSVNTDNVAWMQRMMSVPVPTQLSAEMPSFAVGSSRTRFRDPFGHGFTRPMTQSTIDPQPFHRPVLSRLETSSLGNKRKRPISAVTDQRLPQSDVTNAASLTCPPHKKARPSMNLANASSSSSGPTLHDFRTTQRTPSEQQVGQRPYTHKPQSQTAYTKEKPRRVLVDRKGERVSHQTVIDTLGLRRRFPPTYRFRCLFPQCNTTFLCTNSLYHFREHLYELGYKEDGPHKCLFCEKTYLKMHGLTRHFRDFHLRALAMDCASCGKTISRATKEQIERHLFSATHADIYEAMELHYAFLHPEENADVDVYSEDRGVEEEDEFQEGSSTGRRDRSM